jgi:transposase
MFAAKEPTVRELIKTFNDRGFAALDPKARRGSTPRIGPSVREQICRTANSSPDALGCPFTCWSLATVRDYLAEQQQIRVSRETIRKVLKNAGISFQSTKTWKHSNDPQFVAKKARILDLYDHAPDDGRVICMDEFGAVKRAASALQRMVPPVQPETAAGVVSPHRRRAAHVRRPPPGQRSAVLPHP